MAKGNSLNLPQTPSYYENPNLSPNITFGSDYFTQLLRGDFTGDRAWLSPLTNTNTSANALSYAQGILQPQFRDTLNQIRNEAAANGQLESSTFSDALARSQSDLNSQYQSIVSQGAINDAYQNNANRLNLLGLGNQGLEGFTNLAQNQTNSKNQFNLQNYENQVAAAIAGQKQQSGGFLGALTGGIGGALGGASFGPLGAIAGGIGGALGGGFTPQSSNLGGSILGSGASLYGSNRIANSLSNLQDSFRLGGAAPGAGAYASNGGYGSLFDNSNFIPGRLFYTGH